MAGGVRFGSGIHDALPGCIKRIPCRYSLAFLAFWGFVFNYAMRINMNIVIVAMVNHTAIPHVSRAEQAEECHHLSPTSMVDNGLIDSAQDSLSHLEVLSSNRSSSADAEIDEGLLPAKETFFLQEGEFAWDEETQGIIMGSFFWGYIVTQVPGGRIGELYGVKRVFGVGMLVSAFLTLLTPLAARLDYRALVVVRILIGMFEGVTYPSMHAMLSRWIPPYEKNKLSTFVYTGAQVGTILTMPLAGVIAANCGWDAVFYILGAGALMWSLCWMIFAHDTPESHPGITTEELNYILEGIGGGRERGKGKLPVPWKSILKSRPFWALVIVSLSTNWGFFLLLTELPTYLRNMLHYDIKKNGFISALPYICMWVMSLFLSTVSDHLRRSGRFSFTTVRNINNSIAHYGPALCFICVVYVGCDEYLSLALFVAAGTMQAGFWPGTLTNHLDLAPNFAGTLLGMTNCIASFASFTAPMTTGMIIEGKQTLANWSKVFWLAAGVNVVGNTIFLIFGSSEEAEWNRPPGKEISNMAAVSSTATFLGLQPNGRDPHYDNPAFGVNNVTDEDDGHYATMEDVGLEHHQWSFNGVAAGNDRNLFPAYMGRKNERNGRV